MKYFILSLLFITHLNAFAQEGDREKENDIPITESEKFDFEIIVDDLDIPWGMDFMPDGSFLITEKEGKLIHFKDGEKTTITGTPEVYARGQGGLLDVRLSPNFDEDQSIYLTYSSTDGPEKGGHTALMVAKLSNNELTDKKVLYKATPNTTKGQHWGSRIVFDNDGHVFFTIGERGERDVNPQ
ncbi:MAG: PQQ-dependent sugar dehydrogenase, partial [Leeuwenhoekiella sp.]